MAYFYSDLLTLKNERDRADRAGQAEPDQSMQDQLAPGQFIHRSSVALPPMTVAASPSNRHEVNPALALKLLRDIEQAVVAWQCDLRQVVGQIERLYAQGPIIDGWLESSADFAGRSRPAKENAESTLLRHGDADALMQYVEALESDRSQSGPDLPRSSESRSSESRSSESRSSESRSSESGLNLSEPEDRGGAGAQYRLCWLSDEGKVRSQVCPPEQLAVVSTAIARYQKCKQLLAQQRQLEAKLQSAVDSLTGVRNTAQC